ncbi:hypothetical protein [Mycolicibacterium fortuitum]|uniref:Uncharacterized protein n=2 Tax=Mycolicibacterium fortuitum TaxID=1766 RepID=A0AAE4VFR9_MYCFO|nr:hypothetical protein [Mycolicibacterium fortuitum]MCV7137921.1 hypothetical protein [Mycolicibacterium fortuitum]MDV7194486.1 hypothetical protein [Mycolicibacterium fortuitum]MDV7207884.1 hypothetical protein [Mycolicibacterium fortuitum]MDV7229182.1 hypothetical protein [Mycolicibacterium fortuitum]MDV7260881.1 hypothetical protein [Mycolicibacterium fortuitum]
MAFDDLTDADLAAASGAVAAAALRAARLEATRRLLAGPGAGASTDPNEALEVLMTSDHRDPRYELLHAFEKPWALLVVRILATVCDPTPAIADARLRGVTVPAIAKTLGVSHQAIYSRYADVVRKPR